MLVLVLLGLHSTKLCKLFISLHLSTSHTNLGHEMMGTILTFCVGHLHWLVVSNFEFDISFLHMEPGLITNMTYLDVELSLLYEHIHAAVHPLHGDLALLVHGDIALVMKVPLRTMFPHLVMNLLW